MAREEVALKAPPTLIEKALAEQIRLRAWLKILSNCKAESSAEDRVVRRIRFMARRALDGEAV